MILWELSVPIKMFFKKFQLSKANLKPNKTCLFFAIKFFCFVMFSFFLLVCNELAFNQVYACLCGCLQEPLPVLN